MPYLLNTVGKMDNGARPSAYAPNVIKVESCVCILLWVYCYQLSCQGKTVRLYCHDTAMQLYIITQSFWKKHTRISAERYGGRCACPHPIWCPRNRWKKCLVQSICPLSSLISFLPNPFPSFTRPPAPSFARTFPSLLLHLHRLHSLFIPLPHASF